MLLPRVVNLSTQLRIDSLSTLHHLRFRSSVSKKDLSVTSDLTIDSSLILISVLINDSLTRELIFQHNQDPKWLVEAFIVELVGWQKSSLMKL